MATNINIPAIFIANLMGLMILFSLTVGNSWQAKKIYQDNPSIRVMFLCSLVLLIVDPICFLADGKEGYDFYVMVYWGNVILYIGNYITALMWVKLIIDHLGIKMSKIHKIVLNGFTTIHGLFMIGNLIWPIAFYVDEYNVYHRAEYYWVHLVFYFGIILFGLLVYHIERKKSGKLKFFPIWAFLVPVSIGFFIQSSFYGLSTITPFITIALGCLFISLQNEFIYRDKLTGLYNRFYLEMVEKAIYENDKQDYSAMMLDINDFKSINDRFGHKKGDEALVLFGNVLHDVIGTHGEVIRYAGDEFLLIVNTVDVETIEKYIKEIQDGLQDINQREDIPYELSAAIGYCRLELNENGIESYLDKIDALMYENKRAYYQATGNDRRQ